MNVQLVAVTQPRIDTDDGLFLKAEEFLAYVARVSNPSNQMNTLTAPKLMKYLVEHQHWSPFEMVSLTMEINTTRDIGRQILRHRSFSFQEFSQRYADVSQLGEMFSEPREARLQDLKNRQNSIQTDDDELKKAWFFKQEQIKHEAKLAYKWALDSGIAKEQARVILPEGLIKTRMYMAGTLRSWIHYCQLRTEAETQKEHREIAQECWKIIIKEFPSLNEIITNI